MTDMILVNKAELQKVLETLEALNEENSYWWQEVDETILKELNASEAALRQAIAEAEAEKQERGNPVCWEDEDACPNRQACCDAEMCLYTHPQPKREWVGLTEEEIEQGCKESWVTLQAWQSAVWWAEAKLKEKNT